MNRRTFLKTASAQATLAATAMVPLAACAANRTGSVKSTSSTATVADATTVNEFEALIILGEITVEGLQFVREEEKLARDVYITLYNQWGSGIFNNISSSEQTHTDKVKSLLDKYQIPDPAATTAIGEFVDPKILEYYRNLVARGSLSSLEALYVGAYIEELDIGDLRREINLASSSDVKNVYTNLMYGSYNHLQSFVGQIQKQGITYLAQLLDQNDVDDILKL